MTDHVAAIRAAVQAMLDDEGDGYQCGQIVIAIGLERVTEDGVQAIAWPWVPPDQADWQTRGLLRDVLGMMKQQRPADIDD